MRNKVGGSKGETVSECQVKREVQKAKRGPQKRRKKKKEKAASVRACASERESEKEKRNKQEG